MLDIYIITSITLAITSMITLYLLDRRGNYIMYIFAVIGAFLWPLIVAIFVGALVIAVMLMISVLRTKRKRPWKGEDNEEATNITGG